MNNNNKEIKKSQLNSHLWEYDDDGNIKDIKEVEVITKIKKQHFKKGSFCTMLINTLLDFILDHNYSYLDLKVLAVLLDNIDFNNRISSFTQNDIAKVIGSTQPRVSKSLKNLLDTKVIYKDGKDYYFSDTYIKYAGASGYKRKSRIQMQKEK